MTKTIIFFLSFEIEHDTNKFITLIHLTQTTELGPLVQSLQYDYIKKSLQYDET